MVKYSMVSAYFVTFLNAITSLFNIFIYSLGYKVFTTMINTQVHGLLVKYLSFAQTQTPAPNSHLLNSSSSINNDSSSSSPPLQNHHHPSDLQRRKTEPFLTRSSAITNNNPNKFGPNNNTSSSLQPATASSRFNNSGLSTALNHHHHPGRLVSPKPSITSIPDSDETSEISGTDSISGRRSSLSVREVDGDGNRVESSLKTSKSENDMVNETGQSNCSVM